MKKVLVIEDEAPIRENIIETLELNGYTVWGAANGVEGVQTAREFVPDLIICDIMMDEMDGYGVLEHIRQDSNISLTPFIFITAKADRNSMRQGMELGADDYIVKPFTSNELLNSISTRLSRHNAITTEASHALDDVKKHLVQVVAHELRTPLTAISMSVDLLSRELYALSPEELQSIFETLISGSGRLSRLIEQMTLMTQVKTGTLNNEAINRAGRPIDLWTLLIAAVNMARSFAVREVNTNIAMDEQDAHVNIRCDREALRNALAEIISNAILYSPANTKVNISQWQAGDFVWVSIIDQGPGLTEEQIAQALTEFGQVDRHIHEQQGMGIGLPLAQRIFEAHGGRMEMRSVPGKGTQVIVGLPIYQ